MVRSGGPCTATKEMKNEKNDTNDEQDVDETRTYVKRQKAHQPKNDQD
jgi:hypothetical protein